jgi:uncharacterized membrane protein
MSWAARFELRQYLKGSLWVLPLLGGVLGAVLSQVALAFDGAVTLPPDWRYSASTASGVLTAIVGAMVALIGFVVTIGVLVVQQATGTLSPRYMRLWYRDRLQKFALATFAGTFTFAFSLLRQIEDDFVPDIGVTLAGFAVAASIGLLLIYLDRFTHNLRPVAVAALVGQSGGGAPRLEPAVRRGRRAGGGATRGGTGAGGPLPSGRCRAGGGPAVPGQGGGPARCRPRARPHRRGLLTPGTPLVEVHGTALPAGGRQLRGLFALGRERTIEQDPAFALRILVDVAIKALSPAINDPTTAVQVLDHIETFVETVAHAELSDRYALPGPDGTPRVLVPGRGWPDYLQLAVTEIREYGASSTQVCRRLRALLDALLATVPPDRRPAVQDELCRLDAALVAAFPDPAARARAAGSDRQGIGGRTEP